MTEPENLVLMVLRELRQDNLLLRQEMQTGFARLDARMDEMNKRMDAVSQAQRGESVLGRYAALEVDDR